MSTGWRVGVIGHTGHGDYGHNTHLAFRGLPGVEIVAVADPDELGRNKAQAATGARTGYADWRELIERERPDAVCVCQRWATDHVEIITAAAQAGCHVYCEKPMAASLEDADRMIEAADAAGVRLAVAHLARYAETFQTARDMIRRGDIGRLLTLYGRGKEDHRGGGEDMVVLGTHILDLFPFFAGAPQWVFGHVTTEGRAMVRSDAHEPTEPIGPVAGDEIVALCGFADGVRGHFESRRGLSERGPRLGLTIVGSEGTLAVRYEGRRRLRLSRAKCPPEEGGSFEEVATPPPPDPPGAEPLQPDNMTPGSYFARNNRMAALDLVRAVEDGREPLSSARDARWALEMILGVYASHLAGCALPLPAKERRHPLA